jgi:hypothetical protein
MKEALLEKKKRKKSNAAIKTTAETNTKKRMEVKLKEERSRGCKL